MKHQDPYGGSRKVSLPRESPEHTTKTLDELYTDCEALVETLSQASEELRAKEEKEEVLRVTGIDDIEIYSVEEGSDQGEVEVSGNPIPLVS